MNTDAFFARCPRLLVLAIGLALALPVTAAAQEAADEAGVFLAADFMDLPLPGLFAQASGTREQGSDALAGHQDRVVFNSASLDALAVIEADFFDDPANAQAAFDAWAADAAADASLIFTESAWVSLEDPSTAIGCWHEPAHASLPPDWVECRSWTDGRSQVIGIWIEGAVLDSQETVQALLRQGHDMLRISWFTAEETAL